MNAYILLFSVTVGQLQAPLPPQGPPVIDTPIAKPAEPRGTYMDACNRAVRENMPMAIFIGKEPYHIPGMICGKHTGAEFPGVTGPAIVFSEPDGKGWLTIKEVRRDTPTTFRAEQRTVRPVQQQIFRGGGGRSGGGSC